jgi:PST family polysaccharide transporter
VSAALGAGSRAKSGIAWVLGFNLANQVLQFGVGVVLARLLAPEDFGIFAITGIFTGLAATVSNFGLGTALVQRSEIHEGHRRSMLAANLLGSAAIVGLFYALSPLVGRAFKNPLAGPVLELTAWNFLINAMSSVSFSLMSRALRFRDSALIEGWAAAGQGLVAIVLAVSGFGVWAIAWAGIAQSLVRALLLIARSGWRPALAWDRNALRDLVGFGAGLTLKRVLNYCAVNVDQVVVGRRLSTLDLGYYSRAYSLITLPLTQLSRVIMAVLFPTFSRIQDDNPRLIAGYTKVVTATALVSFPFLVGLGLTAPAFIAVVYGEKWLPTALPLQIMCVAGMMKAVSTYVGSIVDAKGKVGAEIRRQVIYLVLLVAGAFIGSSFGTIGVATSVVVASLAMLVMMQSLLGRLTGMRWSAYFGALTPALSGTAVMAVAVLGWQTAMGGALGPRSAVLLLSSTAIGAAVYLGVLFTGPFPQARALFAEAAQDWRRLKARGVRQIRPAEPRPPGGAPAPSPPETETCPDWRR